MYHPNAYPTSDKCNGSVYTPTAPKWRLPTNGQYRVYAPDDIQRTARCFRLLDAAVDYRQELFGENHTRIILQIGFPTEKPGKFTKYMQIATVY